MTDEEKRKRACENSRRYYQAHKEEILQKQAAYRKKKYAEDEEYRKKVYTRTRKWAEKNKIKLAKMKKDWYKRNHQPTKDEIIEWLETKAMWLKDTLADREDYIFHLECLVEDREKEIDKAVEYLEQPYRDNFDYSKTELLQILRGDDKKVDELKKEIRKWQQKELKEEDK